MTPIRYIRENVFRLNVADFAKIIGVGQGSVSRWEFGAQPTARAMAKIRLAAQNSGHVWNDSLFFEVPGPRSSTKQDAHAA
jgi:DNA-binding transcriptional regulator YiaG